MSQFRSRTINALGWAFASQGTSQIVSVVLGIVLARLLVPDDFGLIAMVLGILGIASLFADIGLTAALIQSKDATTDHFNSVFWLNNTIGLILAIIVILASPLLATFYHRPEIESIATALSCTFVLGALATVPRTTLTKALSFRELAITDFVSMIVGGAVAITMALNGYGYWSLVGQLLLRAASSTLLIWLLARWTPSMSFNLGALHQIFGFSTRVLITRLLQYLASNISNILLGKFLSAQAAGIFDKAQSMMLFPIQNVSHVLGSVMFPSLSEIQDDIPRVRNTYVRVIRTISLLTFPMMIGMLIVADSFVFGLLGEQWSAAIPILRILCVAGVVSSVVAVTGSVYLSLGRADLQLKVNLAIQPLRIIGVIIGLQWGLFGVAVAFVAGHLIAAIITLHYAGNLIGLRVPQIMRNLLPALIMSAVMGGIVWVCALFLEKFSPLLTFVAQVLIGLGAYVALVIITKPTAYRDIRQILAERLR